MSDNLANEWGTILCLDEGRSWQHSRAKDSLKKCNDELKSLMRSASNGKFRLEKTTPSGTDANLWAVMDVSGGDSSRCLFACGSYVASDNGPIQSWSTSDFSTDAACTWIMSPKKASDFAKKGGVALPYHIPCDFCCHIDQTRWMEFENKCLYDLHLRYLESVLAGKPFIALFLELILAGNGGILSERFLKHLGILLKHLGVTVIVDEIMTGGRCNDKCLLLTQTTPNEFQDVVSHITLGKWTAVGIVLRNCKHSPEQYDTLMSRGSRHIIDTTPTVAAIKTVLEHMCTIDHRRNMVLEKILKSGVDNSWGLGLLVFSSRHRTDTAPGLKCRYLPLMNETPIDKIPMSRSTGTTNCDCCAKILEGVKEWLEYSESRTDEAERKLCRALIDNGNLSNQCFDLSKPRKFLKGEFDGKQTQNHKRKYTNRYMENLVDQAEANGLLVHLTRGSEVLSQVRAATVCYKPVDWESDKI
jgi:hypothetical protein